ARYVRGHFSLRDRSDRPVLLRWDGLDRHDDAVVIRLEGALSSSLVGARVANLLLTERFRDQVNVVRASWPGGSATLLFTQGDNGKGVRWAAPPPRLLVKVSRWRIDSGRCPAP